ncbi:MAG: hypothetical protein HQK81_09135 [Desulfovibrionaceae bacterium]|nr:hypothetical protein [Desulfovibrionaceae bacterium]
MTPPPDAWLLGLGLTLCAAFFCLLAFAHGPGVRPRTPVLRYETIRWIGLAGAAALALFALGRFDAVMLCALAFFAALLLVRPRAGGGKGGSGNGRGEREEEDRGENPLLCTKGGFPPGPPFPPKNFMGQD